MNWVVLAVGLATIAMSLQFIRRGLATAVEDAREEARLRKKQQKNKRCSAEQQQQQQQQQQQAKRRLVRGGNSNSNKIAPAPRTTPRHQRQRQRQQPVQVQVLPAQLMPQRAPAAAVTMVNPVIDSQLPGTVLQPAR